MISKAKHMDILDYALPLMGQLVLTTLMSIIDLMMVGFNGGNVAITTVSLSSSFIQTTLTIIVSSGISVGIIALISRRRGEGRTKKLQPLVNLSILMAVVVSAALYLFLSIFKGRLLVLSGAKQEIYYYGLVYMRIALVASALQCFLMIFSSIYIGLGNTKVPFIANIIVFVTKLVLGYLLVLKAEEVKVIIENAALSYVAAFLLGALYLVIHYFFYIAKSISLDKLLYINTGDIVKLIKLSTPASLEEAFYAISRLLGNIIILYTGSVNYAANEIANSVENISLTPGLGLGMAATSLVALYYGRCNKKEIRESAKVCAFWAVLIMSFCGLIFLLIPEHLVGYFSANKKDEMISLAGRCLMIGALEQPFIAISTIYASSIKGLGDTKSPMVVSLVTAWLIRLPLIYYFILIRGYGVTAVWWITALQWSVDAALLYVVFQFKLRKIKETTYLKASNY